MTSVTIIGTDGAGKTTVSKQLVDALPVPAKYVYMGANIESSNVALPTSRLMLAVKRRQFARRAKRRGIEDPTFISTHHEEHRSVKYGAVLGWLRNLNRLLEALYRHLVSWTYQKRGYLVIKDRSLLFDSAWVSASSRRADRAYRSILERFYPVSDLVVLLDAPPSVALERKGEGSIGELSEKRAALLQQGRSTPHFEVVDAAQPLESVIGEVVQLISSVAQVTPSRIRSKGQD